MDAGRIGPLALAEQKLLWLDRRQTALAQNVANADTPGYQPRDLPPFAAALQRAESLLRTDQRHLGPPGSGPDSQAVRDRTAVAHAPNGNAVSLEQQALKVAETDQAHALAIGLHHRWLAMFRTALGRNS